MTAASIHSCRAVVERYWQHMTQLCHRGIDWRCITDRRERSHASRRFFRIRFPRCLCVALGEVSARITTCSLLSREVAMNEKLIVQMSGKRTRIFNTKVRPFRSVRHFHPPLVEIYDGIDKISDMIYLKIRNIKSIPETYLK